MRIQAVNYQGQKHEVISHICLFQERKPVAVYLFDLMQLYLRHNVVWLLKLNQRILFKAPF